MAGKLSRSRRDLLVELESILGGECYNANIQNYGPGGVRLGEGRAFRYPITMRDSRGRVIKCRDARIPASASDEMVRSGYYAFGANQLDVMEGIEKILQLLERRYKIVVG